MDKLQPIPREHLGENFKWRDWLTRLKDRIDTISLPSGVTTGTSIVAGNGSGGFSNVTIGAGLTYSAGTLSVNALSAIAWPSINFAGSAITDIVSRNHEDLQNINSTNYTHLTSTQYGLITAGADTTLHYHATDRDLANATGNLSVSHLDGGTSASSTTFWRGDGTWATPSASGGVTSLSGGTTGLTPNTPTTGAVVLAGTLAIANGGTGLTSVGANGTVLTSNGSTASWATPTSTVDYSIYAFAARH